MGLRRRSREKALQILYSLEFNNKGNWQMAVEDYYRFYDIPSLAQQPCIPPILPITIPANSEEESATEERDFLIYLLYQVHTNMQKIESLIERAAINWRIERIALIERNILRLSVAELIDEQNSIPFKATINEAIDIAKKFGNKESSSFVNGIINKVADMIEIKLKKL